MPHLTERELELVRETAKVVMKEAGHMCHFDEVERKLAHECLDPSKDRIPHLIEIADAAKLVGIETDGHIVLFSVGKQVTIIGQNVVGRLLVGLLVIIAVGLVFLFGWKPLAAFFAAKGV